MPDYLPPPNDRTAFEAHGDRAREIVSEHKAAILAAAEMDRRSDASGEAPSMRGRVAAFLDLIRAKLGAIRGE